ncbi:GAF domain-containing protein [Actinomycetospora cinnamomea]|uniref:GAF domain-containing protein n=1 Tax=Actinomycetospora cinnamomea TaxID=663609 RepID=A0A2U1F2B6_9PSEU|nr:GAF domain-containing protein [Actinomycetospora cinnamomea]PVZ06269.1 GAF domain-containing protein [Actinomycetospora cinnamomea]
MPDRSEPATPSKGLAFSSVARLELDELLDQLIARATEVKLTQGRLRGLLDATHHITAGLELDDLVQRIVESTRALVGARYAALGVVRDGRLIRFVHVGMDPETVRRIGELPQGKGVLGSLIDDPKPLRLDDLATHPASVGFPAEHPPMRSFLGVPLLAGGTVYGNLYVTESAHEDGFTADDEQLLTALAGAAGIAVENALLLENARRRERWQAASAELARSLLSGEMAPEAELQHLLDTAVEVARAHGAAITEVPDADPTIAHVSAAAGGVAEWAGRSAGTDGSITQAALDADGPVLVADAAADPRTTTVVMRAPEVRSVLAVPLSTSPGGPGTRSVLTLTRPAGEEVFGALEAEMLLGFAAHATTAIELARGRRDREAVRDLEARERLVLALSEQVLARIQRVGLALTSSASGADPALRHQLLAQVAELDDVTRAVRDTVFPR